MEEQWQISGLKSPTHHYFGSLFYKDQLTYVSNYLGEIRAYDEFGKLAKQANTIDDKGQIRQYYFGNDKIMVVKEPYVSGQDKIEELNEGTGASVYTYSLLFSPERLLFVDEELCVVFGNQYHKAKACSLSTLYHVVHPFGNFGERELGDAYRYSSNFYILSLGQDILEYDLSNGNERLIETSNGLVKFRYEDLYHKLYYIDDRKIANLIFPASGSQMFYQNDKRIDDLIFVYNK